MWPFTPIHRIHSYLCLNGFSVFFFALSLVPFILVGCMAVRLFYVSHFWLWYSDRLLYNVQYTARVSQNGSVGESSNWWMKKKKWDLTSSFGGENTEPSKIIIPIEMGREALDLHNMTTKFEIFSSIVIKYEKIRWFFISSVIITNFVYSFQLREWWLFLNFSCKWWLNILEHLNWYTFLVHTQRVHCTRYWPRFICI